MDHDLDGPAQGEGQLRHHTGEDGSLHPLPVDLMQIAQIAEDESVLVGGLGPVGVDPGR